ncbi:hypothetical protein K438DRAFT_1757296 [Mycena galopus ATCC 62051]|nr:hypothetical protein K438DRAFT_1757296 [Mycena galopus ATCC 62051]
MSFASSPAARAAITLEVPPVFNSDTSALAAIVLGVDSQGRTTYAIDDPLIDGSSTVPLTATLVEGASYASYTFSASADGLEIALGFDCDLEGGEAICSGTDSNSQLQTATIGSLQPYVLDVVSTATASGSAPTSPPGSGASHSTSQSSGAPSPSASKPSSSTRASGSISGVLVVGLLLFAHLLV